MAKKPVKPITVNFKVTEKDIQRFFSKIVEDHNGCWVWQGYKNKKGYGQLSINGIARLAHRVSYIIVHNEIPFSYHIDHLCKNTSCVNPDHLEAVLPIVNFYRSKSYYYHKKNGLDRDEDHSGYEAWKKEQEELEEVPF